MKYLHATRPYKCGSTARCDRGLVKLLVHSFVPNCGSQTTSLFVEYNASKTSFLFCSCFQFRSLIQIPFVNCYFVSHIKKKKTILNHLVLNLKKLNYCFRPAHLLVFPQKCSIKIYFLTHQRTLV